MNETRKKLEKILVQNQLFKLENHLDLPFDSTEIDVQNFKGGKKPGLDDYAEYVRYYLATYNDLDNFKGLEFDLEYWYQCPIKSKIKNYDALIKAIGHLQSELDMLALDFEANNLHDFSRYSLYPVLFIFYRVGPHLKNDQYYHALEKLEKILYSLLSEPKSSKLISYNHENYIYLITHIAGLIAKLSLGRGYSFDLNIFYNLLRSYLKIGHLKLNKTSIDVRWQYSVLIFYITIYIFGLEKPIKTKFGYSTNFFIYLRKIFVAALELLKLNNGSPFIPFFEFLLGRIDEGNCGIKSFDRHILTKANQFEILRLLEKFNTYRYTIDLEHITKFLLQFNNPELMNGMVNLLRQIKYYSFRDIQELLELAFAKYHDNNSESILFGMPLGEVAGSTALANYLVEHSREIDVVFYSVPDEILEIYQEKSAICLFDDCSLSGTQCLHIFQEWLGVRKMKPHYTKHCLPVNDAKKFMSKKIRIFFSLATNFAINRLNHELKKLGFIDIQIFVGAKINLDDKPFSPAMNYIWQSNSQREAIKNFLSEVGESILTPRAEGKKWSDERLKESALGFSNAQLLLVFEHNVPKSTLTPLWESGPYNEDNSWIPLFPVSD